MKISASIYSSKEKTPVQLVRELDAHGIDMLHIDCTDNDKVFEDIAAIRQISSTPIDLHIISPTPEKYFKQIEELGIEYVSFQYENLQQLPVLPTGTKTKFGLSIVSGTPVSVFEQAGAGFSFIMLMTTVPGQSGGQFNRESFQKVIAFKNQYPNIQVHVDGGVNDEIAYILRLLGVNAVVSGSYLVNHQSLSAGMLSLHKTQADGHSNFTVSEFATPVANLPVLVNHNLQFTTILQTMDKYAMGFVLITGADGKLQGVVSNADVRKGLLRHTGNYNAVTAADVINTNPVFVNETATVAQIIRRVNELSFIVLFLPVVNNNGTLTGAVLLNNLTRV